MHDVKSTHKVYENRFRVQCGLLPPSAPCAWQLWDKPELFSCDSPEPSVSLACGTHHTWRLTNCRRVTVVSVVYQGGSPTACDSTTSSLSSALESSVSSGSFSSYLSLPHAGLTAMLHHAHSVYRMSLVRSDSGYRKGATISSHTQWFSFYF